MKALHEQDPKYGFLRHKGYATAEHLAAVKQFGYSAVHRRSFSPPALPLEFDTID
jgi:ribonuclease HII